MTSNLHQYWCAEHYKALHSVSFVKYVFNTTISNEQCNNFQKAIQQFPDGQLNNFQLAMQQFANRQSNNFQQAVQHNLFLMINWLSCTLSLVWLYLYLQFPILVFFYNVIFWFTGNMYCMRKAIWLFLSDSLWF